MRPKQIDRDLEELIARFKHWQKGRSFREPLPQEILSSIRGFKDLYSDPYIARRLGMGYERLRRALLIYDGKVPVAPSIQKAKPNWVEIGSAAPQAQLLRGDLDSGPDLIIESLAGYKLVLRGLSLKEAIEVFRGL